MSDVDAVIIGSGAGGLTAALALARGGQRVLVLEQHYAPGGWCHSFQLGGFRFSPGVHYLGRLGEGGALRHLYEGLGVAQDLTFFELNRDGFEHCLVGGERFDYSADPEELLARFQARFPSDARGLARYFRLVERISAQLGRLEAHGLKSLALSPQLLLHGWRTLARVLSSHVSDPLCRAFLSVQCGDHGLPPARAPFLLHAAIADHYRFGGHYPMGGGAALPNALARGLRRHGGELRLRAAVKRILLENGRAIGVELATGEKIRARTVVSNADPAVTYGRLLPPEYAPKKLAKARWSVSVLSFFLAVDLPLDGYDSGNYWYADSTDAEDVHRRMLADEGDEYPGAFASITSFKDRTNFDGRHHTLEAFTFVPYERFAALASRPPEYELVKTRAAAKMLRTLEHLFPGISKSVVFCAVGTPLTNVHYVEATNGNIYGTEKTLDQLGPGAFRVRSDVPGLWLCGASTFAHGVPGAMASGLAAAADVLACRPDELLTSSARTVRTYPADDPSVWPVELRRRIGFRLSRELQPAALAPR